jgi:hypothetical protein
MRCRACAGGIILVNGSRTRVYVQRKCTGECCLLASSAASLLMLIASDIGMGGGEAIGGEFLDQNGGFDVWRRKRRRRGVGGGGGGDRQLSHGRMEKSKRFKNSDILKQFLRSESK